MDELQHRIDVQADRLIRETHILDSGIDRHLPGASAQEAALLTAQAKRVRNAANSLIKLLAYLRDDTD